MFNMKSLMYLLLAFVLFAGSDVFARGSRSSSRSRSSSSSWGRSSSSKKSSWSSKSKSTPKAKPVPKMVKPKLSAADKALATKAKANGTQFKSRAEASKAFKTKNASKYKSTYATKPATRPEHIPTSTKGAGGTTYNVTYNQSHGGYGYMGPSGSWMVYSAMADVAMMSMLMRRNSYAYDQPMIPNPAYHQPVVRRPMQIDLTAGILTFMGIVFIVGMFFVIKGNS